MILSATQLLKCLRTLFLFICTAAVAIVCQARTLPALPEPVSNNAVASVTFDDKHYLFSFMGLGQNQSDKDVHNKAWQLVIANKGQTTEWQSIPSVPSSLALKGRLASVAVGMNQSVYIFGGYTVAEDHSEISTPDVYRYDVRSKQYHALTAMPVPVDDAVAIPYRDRYIYLISGWHNDGNVNLAQVYDTQSDTWQQASPFLGAPVFGHAGAIVNNTIVVCDGVATIARMNKRRTFAAETACYKGLISEDDHNQIDWMTLSHPTGVARYRMASGGNESSKRILFHGGATNPYNYNGVGYNGDPAEPDDQLWVFDTQTNKWHVSQTHATTMDHRGLLKVGDQWVVIGGMGPNQTVLSSVTPVTVDK